jgi:hypothetical protein
VNALQGIKTSVHWQLAAGGAVARVRFPRIPDVSYIKHPAKRPLRRNEIHQIETQFKIHLIISNPFLGIIAGTEKAKAEKPLKLSASLCERST